MVAFGLSMGFVGNHKNFKHGFQQCRFVMLKLLGKCFSRKEKCSTHLLRLNDTHNGFLVECKHKHVGLIEPLLYVPS